MAEDNSSAPSRSSNRRFPFFSLITSKFAALQSFEKTMDDEERSAQRLAKCTCVQYKSSSPPLDSPLQGEYRTRVSIRSLLPPPPAPPQLRSTDDSADDGVQFVEKDALSNGQADRIPRMIEQMQCQRLGNADSRQSPTKSVSYAQPQLVLADDRENDTRSGQSTNGRASHYSSSPARPVKQHRNIPKVGADWKVRVKELAAEGKKREGAKKRELYRSRSISPPSTSSDTAKSGVHGNNEQIKVGKKPSKVRVSVFYTWSFSGQHRRRPPLLPAPLPAPPVDPLLLSVNHCPPLAAMPADDYPTKWNGDAYATAPRNVKSTKTVGYSSARRPQLRCSGYCYSTTSDAHYAYRNIFPYTTLCRSTAACHHVSNQQRRYQCLPPPAYYTGQQCLPGYHIGGAVQARTDVYGTDTPFHYSGSAGPTSALYGAGCAHANQPVTTHAPAWTGPTEGTVSSEKNDPVASNGENASDACNSNGCTSRTCLIGWMLTLTAVIILALAVGLFVQISRESARFEQLQRHSQQFAAATTQDFQREASLQGELHT